MRAVIQAGGKGTRLRPYTLVVPKPIMPLGEQAVIEVFLMRSIRSAVILFTRIFLTLAAASASLAFAADEIHWTITGQTSVIFDWRGTAAENVISYGSSPGVYANDLGWKASLPFLVKGGRSTHQWNNEISPAFCKFPPGCEYVTEKTEIDGYD